MKDFNYYSVSQQNKQSIRKLVYSLHNFNPDNIDSKSEEQRIREELEKEVEARYNDINQKVRDRMEEFKNDLFEELGITNNPKREKLFNKAWEHGHAYGFYEVYNVACDLVELIED